MGDGPAPTSVAKSRHLFWLATGAAALVLAAIVAFVLVNSGPYHQEITKLRPGMSQGDVATALGTPYGGGAGGTMDYYHAGSDRMLVVYFTGAAACGWLLLEVPSTGPSRSFSYSKVVGHGDLGASGSRCFGP
jgi:hypothetical protein